MDEVQVLDGRSIARTRAKAGRFDQISIVLHWLTVFLVVGQLTTAWLVSQGGADAPNLLTAHRSMGTVTWLVVASRLVWRAGFARLPPFPQSMPRLQQHIAKLNEYGLYGLLLLQPLTGLGDTLARGRPFILFLWQAPALFTRDKAAAHLFHTFHILGAGLLLALIGLHASAALFHALVRRDGVIQRMLPWTPDP